MTNSITLAPLPSWRNIFNVFLVRNKSDRKLATPWLKGNEEVFWLSRSAWSFYLVAKFRIRVMEKDSIIVWVPDYFCNASLIPLRSLNVTLKFFPISKDGAPNLAACYDLLKEDKPDLIIAVHYFGKPVVLDELSDFSKEYGAWFVEDCAHCLKAVSGVGEFGDFVLYSPHKFLAIPDGGLLVVRKEGAGRVLDNPADKVVLEEIYHAMVSGGGDSSLRDSLVWLVKRIMQKVGFRSKQKVMGFYEDECKVDSKPFSHPKMSFLAKKLLFLLSAQLEKERGYRENNYLLWCGELLSKKVIGKQNVSLDIGYSPYLARFMGDDSHRANEIFSKLQKVGVPVTTWPDLPPEVISDNCKYKEAVTIRNKTFFLPVHSSISPKQIRSSLKNVIIQED